MEEGVKKNDKSENNDDIKEAECLDDTFLDKMEEEVSDINDNRNEKYTMKKSMNAYMTLSLMRWKNVYMIETIAKMKNMMREKMNTKQQILRAPQCMKVKERLMKKVARILI